MTPRRFCTLVLLGCVVGLGAGCERATVYGTVVDERGELLPGVIVTVQRTREQDLSDAMGAYNIQFRPRGSHTLHYQKTGFTPAVLEVDVDAPRSVQAKAVEMWRVPLSAGVFMLRNYQFEPTTPVEIETFPFHEGEMLYGTQRDPEYITDNHAPIVILHRMPTFDVRLARLEERPFTVAGGEPVEDGPKAWVLADPLATDIAPVDEPEGLLRRLTFEVPLPPGVYAVHWGALLGHAATEKRIFMFQIVDPEAEAPEGTEDTADADEDTADEEETEPAPDNGGF